MDAFLWIYHSLSCRAVPYTLYIVMSVSYRMNVCSNSYGYMCNWRSWWCLENEPDLLSICDVSCQLFPQLSSLFIVTSRPHLSDVDSGHCTLTVLMEREGILEAHWLPHSVRRHGCKSLLLYLFRMTTSSMGFTVIHFGNTFWYFLKLLLRKTCFISKKFLIPRMTNLL